MSTNGNQKFYCVLRKALETGFGVSRFLKNECESSGDLGPDGTGIIDTGDSKSVIGEKLVSPLLKSLHEKHRSQVKWYPSETVFRFGNNGILRSISALFVPCGDKWMKIEVFKGSTPFLISNAFLHALHGDLLVSQSCLRVPTWKNQAKLNRNSKQEEVITLASSLNQGEGKVNKQALQQQPSSLLHASENVNAAAEAAQSRSSTSSVPYVEFRETPLGRGHGVVADSDRGGLTSVTQLEIPLTGPVDPAMEVPVGNQEPDVKRPPGVKNLRHWGQIKFPEGKWKGYMFSEAYFQDSKYNQFMLNHTKLVSPWALSFKAYATTVEKVEKEIQRKKVQHKKEIEAYVRQVVSQNPWRPDQESVDWEVPSRTMSERSSPPPLTKRVRNPETAEPMKLHMEETTKEEKMTRMAILQREVDRLRADLENVYINQKPKQMARLQLCQIKCVLTSCQTKFKKPWLRLKWNWQS